MSSKHVLSTCCVSGTSLSKGSTAVKAGEAPALEELIIQEEACTKQLPKPMFNYSLGRKGIQPMGKKVGRSGGGRGLTSSRDQGCLPKEGTMRWM